MSKIFKYLFLIFLPFTVFTACNEDPVNGGEEEVSEEPNEENFNYVAEGTYALNVIYFIPNDVSEIAESHRRISEILFDGQAFVNKYMKEYGFGNKTYNMMVDKAKNRVKIIYLNGEHPINYYPYEGGGSKILKEVDAYFEKHPTEKKSLHSLIITPVKDQDNRDVPYYGLSRNCFALDYSGLDVKYLGENSKRGSDASKFIGGILHELGHALNLPHNKQKVSDDSKSDRGTALMGSGNYTYGSTPTFLTEASCAILNNCQVISDYNGAYYEDVSLTLDSVQVAFEDGNIRLFGKIQSDQKVNHVCIYHDPAIDDADYDAVSWVAPILNNNTFEQTMPINELYLRNETPYVLRLQFTFENGNSLSKSFSYYFKNGEPVFEFGDRDYLPRNEWSINDYSSQEEQGEGDTGRAAHLIDNAPLTYWHSQWASGVVAKFPHFISIDMNQTHDVAGFSFLQRNGARKVKDIEIYTSNDNQNWQMQGKFKLSAINTVQHVALSETSGFRYFKVVFLSAHDGDQYASMAEIMCYSE